MISRKPLTRRSSSPCALDGAREYFLAPLVSVCTAIMAQSTLARFVVPNANSFDVQPGMVEKFEEKVYEDSIAQELDRAVDYMVNVCGKDDKLKPMGIAVPKAKCIDLAAQYKKSDAPTSMSFSATIWMLDLRHRLMPLDKLDLARTRWAIQAVSVHGQLSKVLDGFAVAAESLSDAEEFKDLRRVERDADLDAVLLVVYWNRPQDETQKHPWYDHMRDLHFKAQRVGIGVSASVERFLRFEEEDAKRNVMGLSTFRRAEELLDLVKKAAVQRTTGEGDADMAARVLGEKPQLKASWSADTCRRYLTIIDRFGTEACGIMSKWEMKFGRGCLLDQLHTMRSAATAAQSKEQMTLLVKTLFWEQTCKLRSSMGQRTKSSAGDSTALCRAILLRHLFFQYVQQIFPKLFDIVSVYGTWKWYHAMYGMDEHGRMSTQMQASDEDGDKDKDDEEGAQTRFESKRRLKHLLDAIAKGKYEHSFMCMARTTSSAMSLDLGCEGMKHIQRTVGDIWALYKAEFPDAPRNEQSLPSTELDVNANVSAGVYTPAHVKASSQIESQEEYQAKLSAYQEECRKAQEESTKDHINLRVAMIISDLDGAKIIKESDRAPFMKEPGRKLFIYDSLSQDPLDWTKLRKLKRSWMGAARVNMVCHQAGQMGQDTLCALKDVYLNFRTERQPDALCEDIVAVNVPGTAADTPKNEALDAAWRSLKALGNKHVGPKIGQIQQNKAALLQQVYTRGVWNRTPDHHLVFTYQAVPRNSTGRKRMRYLSDGAAFGDTAFNVWPVPLVAIANMAKTTQQVHDDIFVDEPADDSGGEDGTGTAVVQDLGDSVIPFPREASEKLTQEMIHVFEIDVGIIFNPGSGKSLMAFIMESRRAVAVVKNKAQRDFIMRCLIDAVKTNNLAADKRPPKPQELTAWETAHGLARTGGSAGEAADLPPVVPQAAAAGGAAGREAAGRAPVLPPPACPTLPPPAPETGVATLPPPVPAAGAGPPPPAATPGLAAFGAAVLR